jgi:hypothetical protein
VAALGPDGKQPGKAEAARLEHRLEQQETAFLGRTGKRDDDEGKDEDDDEDDPDLGVTHDAH